jgi:type I restriction-modification system DNA methylase subunit
MPKKLEKTDTTPSLGFEAKLWATAAALRNNMEVTEYKQVVLDLTFLQCCASSGERDTAA